MNRFLALFIGLSLVHSLETEASVRISSKTFTESYILAELFGETVKKAHPDQSIDLRLGLGGTGMLYEALRKGEIDLYPEYTGTISEAILKKPKLKNIRNIRSELEKHGLTISKPLGFNNTYAIAMKAETANPLGIEKISDLRNHSKLRGGFSYEFMKRADGYGALRDHYDFHLKSANGLEHSLAYGALESGAVDLIDVYSTDAKIDSMDLKVLEDDLEFFPRYDAVIIARTKFIRSQPEQWKALKTLEGSISESEMIKMNALVEMEGLSFSAAAKAYYEESKSQFGPSLDYRALWIRTKEHLFLVLISLVFSILVGVPLGIMANRSRRLAQGILAFSGTVQTIPSLALLCFMIPLLGIGMTPALVALFLYGLLPIVRSTYAGIQSIDPGLNEISHVIGLRTIQRIRWIEIPLSARSILSGIKTSAVINVGTATLAAFIGAGGYGSFIVTGLALNNISVILQGAIPAALLALIIQGLFDWSDRYFVPKGLRV